MSNSKFVIASVLMTLSYAADFARADDCEVKPTWDQLKAQFDAAGTDCANDLKGTWRLAVQGILSNTPAEGNQLKLFYRKNVKKFSSTLKIGANSAEPKTFDLEFADVPLYGKREVTSIKFNAEFRQQTLVASAREDLADFKLDECRVSKTNQDLLLCRISVQNDNLGWDSNPIILNSVEYQSYYRMDN